MEFLSSFNEESIKILEVNNFLFPLIKSELMRLKTLNVDIPNELRESIIKDCCKSNNIEHSTEKLESFLKNNNSSIEKLIELVTREFRINKYAKDTFGHQVESRFLKKKSDLDMVVYSLIRVKDHFKANEIYLRIQDNEEEFGSVAAKLSEGNERLTRGIVGPININKSHPALAKLIRTVDTRVLNKPIRIEEFSLIVRVESIIFAKLDKVMEIQMAKEIFDESVTEEAKGILSGRI